MERWRSDRGTGRKGFHGRFRLGKGGKGGNNASGCGDAPADDGEDGGQADGHREVSGDRRDGGMERRVGGLLHGATRPTPGGCDSRALRKIQSSALFIRPEIWVAIFFSACLFGHKPSFSLWLKSTVGQSRCELESNSERVGRPRVLDDVTVEGARGTRRHDGRLREPSADPDVIAGV